MTLSIIIVNYNVKHFLHQCLKSIERAKQNIDLEIFVVDNNSVDGSVEMIKNKKYRFRTESKNIKNILSRTSQSISYLVDNFKSISYLVGEFSFFCIAL